MALDWSGQGCEGGDTQFVADDERWLRADASTEEAAATVRRFDPAAARYTVERYLLPADTLTAARALQGKAPAPSCGPEAAQASGELTRALRSLLPPAPNERLVYRCEKGSAPLP